MPILTLALHAMATRFEIVLHGDQPAALRAAGEEALAEVQRLEERLSLFRPGSEIARVNALAAREPVRVTPELFALLEHAQSLHRETAGVFDISIAPLMRFWGFRGGVGDVPRPAELARILRNQTAGSGDPAYRSEVLRPVGRVPPHGIPSDVQPGCEIPGLAEARSKVGMDLVCLNPEDFTVRFAREGVMLDLGAIGKGYAIERAAQLLREAGITSALLHGGTSTACAIGHPPDADSWKIAVEHPESRTNPALTPRPGPLPGQSVSAAAHEPGKDAFHCVPKSSALPPIALIPLKDEALSVSAIRGKYFEMEGQTFGHVIDPRTGRPASNAVLAVVVLPSATETDALSTALLTLGPQGHEHLASLRPRMKTLLATVSAGQLHVETR